MSKLLCDIYRSPREQEMYLYVQKQEGLARVPDKLQELFGDPVHVTTLILTPERTLARAEAETVIKQLQEQGFYLQMPPVVDDEMRAIAAQNSKLSHG
ncbi:hypothetical protein Mag101_04110 [Microbulbifer agarilyticus]|uniref:YcgL domain-containing protein Mag101_04110 n=1 Tax=Microbulbifer agarilyticus TaxID=260552 RepID=A0A1Q2M2H6_9GAMM|nr:YcgL domain-containing protein [Microbulbifer agarilyticus]AQQ66911.1 hypothetical protein Mag101_04110 [Microbulbifer agarilyticus]